MKRNERLSIALHALLHLALKPEASMTSAEMSACIGSDPAVIRRTLAGLREAGILQTRKGHGGGWQLARPLADLNLKQVQDATGARIFPVPTRTESPGCLVEQAVEAALDGALAQAAAFLDARLEGIDLQTIAADVARKHAHIKVPS
jgi:DNA-binding IscR family transcriptional regulator